MQTNSLLYRDFPSEIRNPYSEVARAADWSSRHLGLLALAEVAVGYLASLCLSDYRSRADTPDRGVESMLEGMRGRNLTFGMIFQLLRASVQAIVDPLVPEPDRLPAAKLDDVARFVAAVTAIEAAVAGLNANASPTVIDIRHHVDESRIEDGLDWWGGWDRVVKYRNKVVHPGTHRWPVGGQGYWEVMGPLLHDAVVELLVEPTISDSILAHPVASITLVTNRGPEEVVHRVCGEQQGLWFEADVVAPVSIEQRWSEEYRKATTASPFILERSATGWEIRGVYWDLRHGLPPALVFGKRDELSVDGAAPREPVRRVAIAEGRGTAPGTCGEFAQGLLADGTRFHVTCPINKSSSVIAKLRPASEVTVRGLRDYQRKLELAVEYTLELLQESSDGSMYPGIASVNHKTCELVRAWSWYPEFVIVMLVPYDKVDTPSISFQGQESMVSEYEDLLREMDSAIERRSIEGFSIQSTRSAQLNDRFLVNLYADMLSDRLDEFGALGVNVGHTGTVCGMLFPNTDEGRKRASQACLRVRREFGELQDVKVVTTPHWGPNL